MAAAPNDFSKSSFVKTFVLPALLVFLIPVLALAFFLHAQAKFDAMARQEILSQLRADSSLSAEEREQAIAFFTEVPFSRLVTNDEFAASVDAGARFDYATFRWMIRLSFLSIVGGIAVFVLAGVCAWFSMRSQTAQYLSLLVGWHVLRIYGALQTIVVGILLVALSFWVTALWFKVYFMKLIFVAGALAVVGVGAVIVAIFKKPNSQFVVEGTVLKRDGEGRLWTELQTICDKVGTDPPDQVIVGIDDNFFVTEMPVTVDGHEYHGKTLFVSLSLLKHLNADEAGAVLAHEMAHFSGNDTLYSKKITPLLQRFEMYLRGLYENPLTKPVFYFMMCFRALYELSLGRLSREREHRADEIAATTTSPRDVAAALLRIAAYSTFRQKVELELFKHEQAMETADVSTRIEQGFPAYAVGFSSDPNIGSMETPHPFDSHPSLKERMQARGFDFDPEQINGLLASPGDGGWRDNIPEADELERQQWQDFEDRFRTYHEQTLPYRFLPETDAERAVVEKLFPKASFEGKKGMLTIDYEKVKHEPWEDAVRFTEITNCALTDALLDINFERNGSKSRSIPIKKFANAQEVLETFQRYYGRYLAAVEYQKFKRTEAKEGAAVSE